MNLKRLLIQASLSESAFSRLLGARPNTLPSADIRRALLESESELPELLLIGQRVSPRSGRLGCCTRLTAAQKEFEILASDETEIGPLKRFVRWPVERRFGEPIICSTFVATRQELRSASVLIEDEKVKVTIENYVSNKWKRIRQPLAPVDDLFPDSLLVLIRRPRKYFRNRFTAIPTIAIEAMSLAWLSSRYEPMTPSGKTDLFTELQSRLKFFCFPWYGRHKRAGCGFESGPVVTGAQETLQA